MSTDIHDLYDFDYESSCCGAKTHPDHMLCYDCGEYCEAVEIEEELEAE